MPLNPPKYETLQYVIAFTPRTVAALLSNQAMDGESVALDFHVDGEPHAMAGGSGQRHGDNGFIASVEVGGEPQNHVWNFDLLTDRARLHLEDAKALP
ncbi:hypothetical protein [Undibacterium terreum]|uniref:Uncharacterized protein n=1 Tax=Undibacterium terreum TaxID=1224302 RepID=A0A916U824_9BURK|nr:hypothetical protein [Undibacterium terreum]GGC62591.1 hypothetical protein GCM10011396_06940 [Undibacterium terreum]